MSTYNPDNFAKVEVVAGVVIIQDGKILLVQEAYEKARGKWNLPAGRVDEGETIEHAAIREAKEECGLDVTLGEHLVTIHQAIDKPVLHSFLAERFSGELRFAEEELLDAKWFDINEVLKMEGLRNEEYIHGSIKAAQKAIK